MNRMLKSLGLMLLFVNGGMLWGGSQPAYGFKVDTHVWIAQQVLNDLQKGTLSIKRGDTLLEIPVDANVRAAIMNHQAYYRMGSIGPDAVPGIYDGQMTIHPGSEKGGWGTGDWLAHLLQHARTPEELAFTYGFLGHAAGDVFAHTYVNQYAGDIYLLTDGETHVEKRHMLLEAYMHERSPQLLGPGGTPTGAIQNLIIHDGKLAVPVDLLWRAFITSNAAADELANGPSAHFAAIHDLDRTLADLTAPDGLLDKLHLLSQQLVVYFLTDYAASTEELRRVNELDQKLRDWTNEQIDKAQAIDKAVSDEALRVFKEGNQVINDHLAKAHAALSRLPALVQAKHDAEQKVIKAEEELRGTAQKVCKQILEEVCNYCPPGDVLCKKSCDIGPRVVCNHNDPAYVLAKAAHEAAQGLERSATKQLLDDANLFRNSLRDVLTASENILREQNKILHSAIDLIQRFHKDVDPISGLFKAWRSDIEKAMKAYFMANAKAIRNTMTGDDPMEPLKFWVKCFLPSISGLPSQVVEIHCRATAIHDEISRALTALVDLASVSDPLLRPISAIKKEIDSQLESAKRPAILLLATKATGIEVEEFLDLMKRKPTKVSVDQTFAQGQGDKKILVIDRVSDRVDADMYLKDGKFSLDKYAVVFNALVLAKMSLLDAKGLNVLADHEVYSGKDLASNNVMVRFPFSIDGNHHWLKVAPPYPRASGEHAGGKHYGFPEGFALWETRKVRSQVFRKIFIGPLNPGIETPNIFGFPEVLPSSYDYRPTVECPFPNYPSSDSCGYTKWDGFLDWIESWFR